MPKGRRIHPRDLMGAAEVCELVGWKQRKSILDAMRTGGFPEPSARLKGGAIWDGGKVRKWLARRERIRRNPQGEPSPGDIWRAAKEEQADQNG